MPYNPLALIFDGLVLRPIEFAYEQYLRLRIGPKNCEELDAEIENDSLRWTQLSFQIIYGEDLSEEELSKLEKEMRAIEEKDYYEKYLRRKRQ